ncbi:hypothetical protein Clacol_010132 [Clathrus columnatus]|uniref:DASH complex subunit ASK1 n=1 Tax=Clathrus columnatus TaxID=1419009 RepID=A0AAV5AMM3_9AGAM|nr:hypothetical protein Clacol_010132 [Clathrus columnatus]
MDIKPRSSPWTPSYPADIVIPGVDPTASINEQIDRIDQLITIKLQNIDANIARANQLISTKLLPALKRFAEGTEPVREAAKFWKSFFEAAAQVRIPLASDVSLNQTEEETTNLQGEQQEEEEGDTTVQTYEAANTTPLANDSFIHGVPISSTPLIRDNKVHDEEDSWSASIESPFERLHREVQSFTIEEKEKGPFQSDPLSVPLSKPHTDALLPPTRPQPAAPPPLPPLPPLLPEPRSKGKAPLRENILHQNHIASSSRGVSTHQAPRPKTPKNPFTNTRQWNGLVDLRQPTPSRHYTRGRDLSFDDSSDDLIPPGMSPPVTMQFALPPRLRKSPVKLHLSPAKMAAENIKRDFIADAANKRLGSTSRLQQQSRLEPSVSSVVPSLPSSLSKYGYPSSSRISTSISGGTKTSFSSNPSTSQQIDKIMTPAHQVYRSRVGAQPQAATAAAEFINEDEDDNNTVKVPSKDSKPVVMPKSRLLIDDEASLSFDSDSDSSEHNEQNPSNGFLYATQNNAQADDSFSDDGNDSVTEMVRPDDQLHPVIDMFAQFGQQNIDDSFDQDSFSHHEGNEEEETIFGGRQAGQGDRQYNLNLRNDPLIDDSHTGAISLNPFAQVEQSPTPMH